MAREGLAGSPIRMISVILSMAVALTAALPSYIAVPADQIAFVDLSALRLRRVPRQTLSPPPLQPQLIYSPHQLQDYQQQAIGLAPQHLVEIPQEPSQAAAQIAPRHAPAKPPDFGEYVDFGAHTGNNGAFGWYADYPINHNEHNDDNYKK